MRNKKIKLPKCGENGWALVTGCTDGIGLAFTKELCEKGFNIVMISKSETKLESLQQELQQKYNNNTQIHVHNFSEASDTFYNTLGDSIKHLDMKVVINNVGMTYYHPKYITDNQLQFYNEIIQCNVSSILKITHTVLNQCNTSEITFINISSILSDIPVPFFTAYSATKAFVSSFTNYISLEVTNPLMNYYCIKPWYVSTKIMRKKPSFFCPTPEKYVKSIMALGYFIPHIILDICSYAFYIPFLRKYLINRLSQRLLKIRNIKLKKVT